MRHPCWATTGVWGWGALHACIIDQWIVFTAGAPARRHSAWDYQWGDYR